MHLTSFLALALMSGGLAACGSSNSSTSSSTTSQAAAPTTSATTTTTTSAASATSPASTSAAEVEMYDNYFKPKTISGKPGQTIRIKLSNEGKAEHNFKIDGQKSANADVQPGKTSTVEVKIPASGSLQFYCEYHKQLGMVGTVKAS